VFSEAVNTYLNRLYPFQSCNLSSCYHSWGHCVRNGAGIPDLYDTAQGDQYNLDNGWVYGLVKQLILEEPGWSNITNTINRIKDGRAAWLVLRAHYEGDSYINKQKEDAYKMIESLHYKGEWATFTFEHFSGQLTKAYNDL